ncbi:MAG: hypothetical protein IH899_12230 [Planctomycetes bacterium]|nr:hypothetical protein [Planctomycetota bacterium]
MEQYDYKYIHSTLNAEKTLRQVEKHERDGWTLYFLQPTLFLLFGSGGTGGLTAVMRRSRVRDTNATDDS